MKKMIVLAMVLAMSGCALNAVTVTERGYVFDTPVEQLVTTVCNPSGYELTTVQTFVQGESGPVMIDHAATGGAGMGYAMGVGITAGMGSAATSGLLGVWAAHELRPDETNVVQQGGGATAESYSDSYADAYADSYNVNVNENVNINENINRNQMRQAQGQQQQQQQQQRIQPVSAPVQQPPKCNKPVPVSSPQVQKQGQVLIVK